MATSRLSESIFAPLPDRALIRLTGADWRGFLQGLITQDVETMASGEMRYAGLLTPQGRLLYDLFIVAEEEGAWLDVLASTRDVLVSRLKMYRLRAKVQIEPADGRIMALFGSETGPSVGWKADPRLPALGWRGVDQDIPSRAVRAGEDAYDRHRLALGVADVARDGLSDRAYALEANLDLLNGVDFKKGCFVGQETTSRMKRRSVVKSRLVPIRFEGPAPAPQTDVLNEELRAGEVRSGVEGRALALMRLDRAGGAALTAGGQPVELDPPAWLFGAIEDAATGAA